ncbi:MFS transporter [Paraburkholderia metrosideri]|uniref:MFS transporter n=1 Tax=Paraburkholderia metrosideri TaxID=580937 RepID=A0ABW9DRC4_9BURK
MKFQGTPTLSTGPARSTVATKATKKRFVVGFLLFLGIAVNYMDRSNLSLAAPLLGRDLNLSPVQLGLIFSAFGWSYAILQIPGGMLVDRVKPRILYAILLCGWSVATCLQAAVNGFSALFGLRVLLGTFEAPSYPINNRVVTTWFPERERATAIAFYTSGQFVGIAFFMPLLVYIQATFGWRGMLFFTGATRTLNVSMEPGLKADEFTAEKGYFDVAIECTGAAAVLKDVIPALRPRGTIVQVGVTGDVPIPINALVGKEIRLQGAFRFHGEYALAARLIKEGRIDVKPIITATLPIERAIEAFDLAADRSAQMKVQITF